MSIPQLALASAGGTIANLLWQAANTPPAWRVVDQGGNVVLHFDSVQDLTNSQTYEISKFPLVAGSFANYNKVVQPYEVHLRVMLGGSKADRAQLLNEIKQVAGDLNLYQVITPEVAYPFVNLTRYEVTRRGPQGAYWLSEVDLYFQQIIQVTPQYSNSAVTLPSALGSAAQPTQNGGTTSPQTPATTVTAQAQSATLSVAPGTF